MMIETLLEDLSSDEYRILKNKFKDACENCKLKETKSNFKMYALGVVDSKEIFNKNKK